MMLHTVFSKLVCFVNLSDKSLSFVYETAVIDSNVSFGLVIRYDPSGTRNSFVYIQ